MRNGNLVIGALLGMIGPEMFYGGSRQQHYPTGQASRRQVFVQGARGRAKLTTGGGKVYISRLKLSGSYKLVVTLPLNDEHIETIHNYVQNICGAVSMSYFDDVSPA